MATEKRLMSIDDFKRNLCNYCNTYMSDEPCEPGECWVYDVIAQTGSVDAREVVHGHWIAIRDKNFGGSLGLQCSVCRSRTRNKGGNYCPNCGAKMGGDGNG
jgi:hypothetical protein